MHLPQLSTDLIMGTIAGLVVVYGLLAGHNKIRTLALSTYVGIVLANQLGETTHNLLSHSSNANAAGLGIGIVRLILFAAPIVLLEVSRRSSHSRGAHAGMLVTIILAILTAGLIISEGLAQLEGSVLTHITHSSTVAFELYRYHLWIVAIVPIFIIAEAFIKSRE